MFNYSLRVAFIIASQVYAILTLRDLSEIKYKFTPCGSQGSQGPTISQCIKWYSQNNPAIDDRLFEFSHNGSTFYGAQGFVVPKSGLYNVTVAGAAGGRGLCSFQYGRGLVWRGQVYLQEAQRLLLLVGQAGLGPCDLINFTQCQTPPNDVASSGQCGLEWQNWLLARNDLSHSDMQIIYNFAGGGGGGGASMIRAEDSQTGMLQTWPLVVAGGGGGTASILGYGFLNDLNIAIPPDASPNPSLQERFTLFIDAKSTDRDFSITELHNFTATRGYISFLADVLRNRPGAGGGYVPATSLYQDGLALNQTRQFALGGSDCLTYSADLNRHTVVESVHGGFGGGGGQCQSGGSGGGFSGGSVFSGNFGIPGNGGFSTNLSFGINKVQQLDTGLNSELDGFIELVHTDCQCSYECVIIHELHQFNCICPENFELAPNEFDCFQELEFYVNQTEYIERSGYKFQVMDLDSYVQVFSINAFVKVLATDTEEVSINNNDIQNAFCILALLDRTGNVILESNIVQSKEGWIFKLGLANSVMLTDFLETSHEVYGAVLISNYYCSFQYSVLLNISNANVYDNITSPKEPNFTSIISLARKTESYILHKEEVIFSTGPVSASGIHKIIITFIPVVSSIFFILITIIIILSVAILIKYRRKRQRHSFELVSRRPNVYSQVNKTGSLISNKLYVKNSVSSNFNENDVTGMDNSDDHSTSINISASIGVHMHHFHNYLKSLKQTWEHSRNNLIYMKEIGEGHFGKVLLMKAVGMPHIHRDVPVAVKTLSSTDPAVVKKFFDEANLMKKLSHPNIISILAVIFDDVDEDNAPLMILEYMPYGDLKSFLIKRRPGILLEEEEISIKQLLNFARDIAHAIKYLSEKHYIHRDIACRNCLVDTNLSVKLGDFGMTVKAKENGLYQSGNNDILPIKWTSPEALQLGIFSTSSDIWSFGVLLWEMATYGEDPLPGISSRDFKSQINSQTFNHKRPPDSPDYYYDLMMQCHQFNPQNRIQVNEMILKLTKYISQQNNDNECVIIFHH